MRWIEGRIERTDEIDQPIDVVWDVVSSLDRLAAVFPYTESVVPSGEHAIWQLGELGVSRISVRPRATTRIRFEERSRISVESVPANGDTGRISGSVEFAPAGRRTSSTATFVLAVGLSIPALLVPLARPIVQRRVDDIAERLLANVRARAAR